jgi:hypothetical protein
LHESSKVVTGFDTPQQICRDAACESHKDADGRSVVGVVPLFPEVGFEFGTTVRDDVVRESRRVDPRPSVDESR